jgi:hypothetical protein
VPTAVGRSTESRDRRLHDAHSRTHSRTYARTHARSLSARSAAARLPCVHARSAGGRWGCRGCRGCRGRRPPREEGQRSGRAILAGASGAPPCLAGRRTSAPRPPRQDNAARGGSSPGGRRGSRASLPSEDGTWSGGLLWPGRSERKVLGALYDVARVQESEAGLVNELCEARKRERERERERRWPDKRGRRGGREWRRLGGGGGGE